MLRSKLLMTLALLFAAPAVAEGPAVVATGTYEGQPFEYSSRMVEAGKIRIEGRFVDGDRFSFTVKPSGAVVGEVGRVPVDFRVSKQQREKLAKSLKRASEPLVASR